MLAIRRRQAAYAGSCLGNSLRVEQRTLTPLVLVRIQVPQPFVLLTAFLALVLVM